MINVKALKASGAVSFPFHFHVCTVLRCVLSRRTEESLVSQLIIREKERDVTSVIIAIFLVLLFLVRISEKRSNGAATVGFNYQSSPLIDAPARGGARALVIAIIGKRYFQPRATLHSVASTTFRS